MRGMPWIQKLPEMPRAVDNYRTCKSVEIDSRKDMEKYEEQYEGTFSSGLGWCKVTKARWCRKHDARPVFRKKRLFRAIHGFNQT